MKKLLVSTALLSAICLGSCRKEYTCECSTSTGGSTSIVNKKVLNKQALKDARAECDKGDSDVAGIRTECEIKL
ncbi:MAG TPA: hypothetical protein VL092_11980 [Chitinophagaceae bacterium]|nr:hypothetical protein [Chitinophagaceae bacterium]